MSITRRSFLALVAVLAAGCASHTSARAGDVAPGSVASAGIPLTGDFKGPLGVQLYSVRGAAAKDVPGTLTRVHALGFREVELAGTYGMSPAAFRTMLDGSGLHAVSMHVGYERFRDSLPAVLADAKTLGARYVGTAWIPHSGGPLTVAQAHQVAMDFNRWGRAARDAGLTFFYHIHGFEFQPDADGTLPLDVLMRETDRDAVHFELDVFWAARPGADPAALLRKYGSRWALLHLKDMRKGTPTNVHTGSAVPDEAEVPVGMGQIDYRAVLHAARDVGVAHYFVEDETSEPFTTMPQSNAWLGTVRW